MEPIRRAVSDPAYTAEGNKLVGYAAVFDVPTVIREKARTFTELVRRGAFLDSLKGRDVIATFNHDESRLLGRMSSGTLRVAEDAKGLRFEIDLPDTPTGAEVRGLIARGDLRGASFVAGVRLDKWEGDRRELRALDLVELGPVTLPAYTATSVTLGRSVEWYRRALKLRLLGG